jgi:hypothetical protein
MPRKSKQINPFDGGLNNYSDARDIEENELAEAINVDTSNPGRVSIGSYFTQKTPTESITNPPAGKGLFRYNSDWDAQTPPVEGDTEYELMLDGANVKRKESSASAWSTVKAMTGSPDNDYYVADGGVRMSDRTYANDVSFLGVVKSKNFGAGSNTITLVSEDSYVEKPYGGKITVNDSSPKNEAITDGTLYLDLQEESGSKTYFMQFLDGESSEVDGIYTQYGKPDTYNELSSSPYYGRYASLNTSSTNGTSSQTITPPSGAGELMVVNKNSSGGKLVKFKMRLDDTQQQDFTDKSFFFQIFVPTDAKARMVDPCLLVRIGNDVADSGTSGNDCWLYNISLSSITANTWTEIEIEYGKHDEIEGSPNASAVDHFVVEAVFDANSYETDGTGEFAFAVADYAMGASSRGLWNGWYKWYYSWIYDKKQESKTKQLGPNPSLNVEDKIIKANVYIEPHSNGFSIGSSSYSKRITGANIYYVEYDLDGNPVEVDKKLFMNVDFEKGAKKPGDTSYEPFYSSAQPNNGYRINSSDSFYITYFSPPAIDSFETTAGYVEDDKIKKLQYKASTVMNRRSYVGNVKVTDAQSKTNIYEDRVYKSEPNMFDIYTEYSYIDVAINDGDTITCLENFGDFLLQFKNRTMYLINVTQDIEYLESAYEYRGAWGPSAVCKIPEGIAWVNNNGVFLFNGKEVVDLLGKKIDRRHWTDDFIGANPMIGYKPLTQDLVIMSHHTSPRAYVYNIITGSWVRKSGFSGDTEGAILGVNYPWTNLITLNNGTLKGYLDTHTSAVTRYHWEDSTDDRYIKIITKDETLGDPAQRKTLKKVYISYKCANANYPTVKYITNNGGEGNAKPFNESITQSADFTTKAFTPTNAVDANNKYSYQIVIYGMADSTFVLNDISLVYRDKTLK